MTQGRDIPPGNVKGCEKDTVCLEIAGQGMPLRGPRCVQGASCGVSEDGAVQEEETGAKAPG